MFVICTHAFISSYRLVWHQSSVFGILWTNGPWNPFEFPSWDTCPCRTPCLCRVEA